MYDERIKAKQCENTMQNSAKKEIRNPDFLYPELSYSMVGACQDVGTKDRLLLLINFDGKELEMARRIYDKVRPSQFRVVSQGVFA